MLTFIKNLNVGLFALLLWAIATVGILLDRYVHQNDSTWWSYLASAPFVVLVIGLVVAGGTQLVRAILTAWRNRHSQR